MNFTVVVYAAPYSSQAAMSAYRFTRTLLEQGHRVDRLFFFSDGVHNASRLAAVGRDETSLQRLWDELIRQHELPSTVCVTSAVRRGILDAEEAKRHGHGSASLLESSRIAGLGDLIEAAAKSDRVVNFG